MDFHIIIPARLDSTRLARKALVDLGGRPMILRTLDKALESGAASVTVATDSGEIADVVDAAGGQVLMTDPGHRSGTDRLAEAAVQLGLEAAATVVNLQGDEPAMPAACLRQVAGLLAADERADMATLWQPLADEAQWRDPNVVKLVADRNGRALYFSRAPIPWPRDGGWPVETACRHVGLYAYRVCALRAWAELPASALEQLESLEQLRALDAGWRVVADRACAPIPVGIDTAADLARFRAALTGQA
ncbi:MAG: 3-deoxy-manno-octulosonate cytidylyltransferase [Wenzhouxiangella sp.]|nr:MAG: 3-deoxy-manno-octulosonate cytidylyltransferase [Wenzhouxiangella sp.]